MWLLVFRFLFAALCIYLASQAILSLPSLRDYFAQQSNQTVYQVIITLTGVVFAYYSPQMRILHEMGVVIKISSYFWIDVIFSGLALSRMSFVWHYIVKWIETRAN